MLEKPYTKEQIQKMLSAAKKIKFVENFEDVKGYYNKKIYAIEKRSVALKELIAEERFPIDPKIHTMKEGLYYVIDSYSKDMEYKSRTVTQNIGYVLHKTGVSEDYWNSIYQVKLNPLFNYISKHESDSKYSISDLTGKTIYIKSFELDEMAKSYKVTWGVLGDNELFALKGLEILDLYESYIEENFDNSELLATEYLDEQYANDPEKLYQDYVNDEIDQFFKEQEQLEPDFDSDYEETSFDGY